MAVSMVTEFKNLRILSQESLKFHCTKIQRILGLFSLMQQALKGESKAE